MASGLTIEIHLIGKEGVAGIAMFMVDGRDFARDPSEQEDRMRSGALPGLRERAAAVPVGELRPTRLDAPFHVGALFDSLQCLRLIEQLANVLVCRGARTRESRGEAERNDNGPDHGVLVSPGCVVERIASSIADEPHVPFTRSSRFDMEDRKLGKEVDGPDRFRSTTHPKGEETCDLEQASMVLSVTGPGHAGITDW